MVDVTFTFWVCFAMIFFLKGMKERKYFLLFGLSTGICILTKSALGLFPLLIAVFYLFPLKNLRTLKDPYFLSAIAIAFLVSFPWYFYQYINHPEQFIYVHLKWLLFKGVLDRDKPLPLHWYITRLWVYYWPWIPFATCSFIIFSINSFKKVDPDTLILLFWAGIVIGVMSISHSKKFHYIMSAFPPLAILTSLALNKILRTDKIKNLFMKICLTLLLLLSIIVIFTPVKLPPTLSKIKYFQNMVEDIHYISMFAKDTFSKNDKIVLYDIYLWRIRSTFLFYSDRDVYTSVSNKDELAKILNKGETKYCLTAKEKLPELSTLNLHILLETPSLVLLTTNN
jgi:4-amino-4-deoxy-L-arabinose transferase-like glycosyltransferase